MKALILNNKIVDVVETEFEVHSSMTFIDCPDNCTAGEWELDGSGNPVERSAPVDNRNWEQKRFDEYSKLNQFEMQFDDKRDGTTTWVDKINEIKGRHPK